MRVIRALAGFGLAGAELARRLLLREINEISL